MDFPSDKVVKAEAADAIECATEIMKAFPRKKAGEFFGHFNDLMLFLEKVKRLSPEE